MDRQDVEKMYDLFCQIDRLKDKVKAANEESSRVFTNKPKCVAIAWSGDYNNNGQIIISGEFAQLLYLYVADLLKQEISGIFRELQLMGVKLEDPE